MFQPPIFFNREKRTKKHNFSLSNFLKREKKVEIWYFSLQFLKEREEKKYNISVGWRRSWMRIRIFITNSWIDETSLINLPPYTIGLREDIMQLMLILLSMNVILYSELTIFLI